MLFLDEPTSGARSDARGGGKMSHVMFDIIDITLIGQLHSSQIFICDAWMSW